MDVSLIVAGDKVLIVAQQLSLLLEQKQPAATLKSR